MEDSEFFLYNIPHVLTRKTNTACDRNIYKSVSDKSSHLKPANLGLKYISIFMSLNKTLHLNVR